MTARNSIRLLVVSRSPPNNSFLCSPATINAPQPPIPGLPLHAPSVNISTFFMLIQSIMHLVCNRYALCRLRGFLSPGRSDQPHSTDALNRLYYVNSAKVGPPAIPG